MRELSIAQVHALKVSELGLDAEALDLTSIEAIAASLRRAARLHCPCTPASLVRSVIRPLVGLVDDVTDLRETTTNTLQTMTAYGDFIEEKELEDESRINRTTLIYQAPLSFVSRRNGVILLIGTATDLADVLPEMVYMNVEYSNHVRRLTAIEGEDLHPLLVELGLVEMSIQKWMKSPQTTTAEVYLNELNTLLDRAQSSGGISNLRILDSSLPVNFYNGRWVDVSSQTGRFIGRRPRKYGADIWCYVELDEGIPTRLLDFPRIGSRWRGCDEAWYLQLAIDAVRNVAQSFDIVEGPKDTVILRFFSPIPLWGQRRLDAFAEPLTRQKCLFRYRLPIGELEEEIDFLSGELWLSPKFVTNHVTSTQETNS